MRRKRALWFLPIVPIAGIVILTAMAGSAESRPSFSGACSGCHDADASVSASVTVQSQTDTTVTYAVSGSTANDAAEGWGAFLDGGGKIAGGTGPGTFTVAKDGAAYTVFWVDKSSAGMGGYTTATVTAPSPTVTTDPPVTVTTDPPTTTDTTTPPTTDTTVTTTDPGTTTGTTLGSNHDDESDDHGDADDEDREDDDDQSECGERERDRLTSHYRDHYRDHDRSQSWEREDRDED